MYVISVEYAPAGVTVEILPTYEVVYTQSAAAEILVIKVVVFETKL